MINNRTLTSVEGDGEYPILTPNTLVIGQNLMLPDKNLETENKDLCKRFKYIRKCLAQMEKRIYHVIERTS